MAMMMVFVVEVEVVVLVKVVVKQGSDCCGGFGCGGCGDWSGAGGN